MSKTIKITDQHERYAVQCDSAECEGRFIALNWYRLIDDGRGGEIASEMYFAIQHCKFCPMCGKPIKAETSE